MVFAGVYPNLAGARALKILAAKIFEYITIGGSCIFRFLLLTEIQISLLAEVCHPIQYFTIQ